MKVVRALYDFSVRVVCVCVCVCVCVRAGACVVRICAWVFMHVCVTTCTNAYFILL